MGSHGKVQLQREAVEVSADSIWSKLMLIGVVVALVGLGGSVGLMGETKVEVGKWWTSYLTGYIFASALALGALAFVLIQHLTRAQWSVVLRRLAENLMLAVPVLVLLGAPIFFMGGHHDDGGIASTVEPGSKIERASLGEDCSATQPCTLSLMCSSGTKKCEEKPVHKTPGSHHLYHWTHAEVVANDEMLKAKEPYLNEGFQKQRIVVYFVGFGLICFAMWRWSVAQDTASDPGVYAHKQRRWAPLSLFGFAWLISFWAFDHLMSLDPHWFSTIFGVYVFAGSMVTVHSLLVIIAVAFQRTGYLQGVVTTEHFHDLGKYMFGFTVFWAYIGFSQYFLIWYANIPEETNWYSYRGHGDWLFLSLLLVFGRFILPFFALLRQPIKRSPQVLVLIAVFILCMEYIDIFWLVQPAFAHQMSNYFTEIGNTQMAEHFHENIDFGPVDVMHALGFLGVLMAVFGYGVRSHALVPVNDPRLQESLQHENF